MSHSKVIDEIYDELIDKIFPNTEADQHYGKFIEMPIKTEFETKYLCKFPQINESDYLWYKLCVYYHAKTELFDRKLTDLRSPYDPTEAYMVGEARKISNVYAMKIREFVYKIISEAGQFNCRVNDFNYLRLSAQGWIDEYNRLVDAGEMDFINKYLR